jgi:hypothetical protein
MTEEEKKRKEYASPWQAPLEETWKQIQDRPGFQYDVNADALWNRYKDQYIRQGKLAMEDSMGQAQAMTGGYGNSYAQTVGQQTYQGYLQNLGDRMPQFIQLAQDRYDAQGQALKDRYGILSDLEEKDYSRWLDAQTQQNWQTEWDESIRRYNFENGLGDYAAAPGTGEEEDTGADPNRQAAKNFVDKMLASGTNSKFDPERIVKTTNQLTQSQKEYAKEYLKEQLDKGAMK